MLLHKPVTSIVKTISVPLTRCVLEGHSTCRGCDNDVISEQRMAHPFLLRWRCPANPNPVDTQNKPQGDFTQFLPFTVSALCFFCGHCHRRSLPSCWPATVHPWGSQSKWKTGGKWGLKQLSVAPVQLNGPQINAEQSWKKKSAFFSTQKLPNCKSPDSWSALILV